MATPAQQAAFSNAVSGYYTMGELGMMIALMASSLILLFAGWVTYTGFRLWVNKEIDLNSFVWAVIRVLLVVVAYGYYIRP